MLDLLLDFVLIVEPMSNILLFFDGSGRISHAYNLTYVIYFWLKVIHSFFGVLIFESFSLFALADNELVLACLKVFVVSLVHFLLVHHEFACVADCRVESVRVGSRRIDLLVLHRANRHLGFHIAFNTRLCVVVKSVHNIVVLNVLSPLDYGHLL